MRGWRNHRRRELQGVHIVGIASLGMGARVTAWSLYESIDFCVERLTRKIRMSDCPAKGRTIVVITYIKSDLEHGKAMRYREERSLENSLSMIWILGSQVRGKKEAFIKIFHFAGEEGDHYDAISRPRVHQP
jgi:hypothetical protein